MQLSEPIRRTSALAGLLGILTLVPALPSRAQERPPQMEALKTARPGDTVLATPAGRFEAGFLYRALMGDGYRDLWPIPVPAEILDLENFAGGLSDPQRGGGLQTRSLRFQGADGYEYNFRSLDKDAARSLDPVLRQSLAAKVAQDFVSALFPLSSLVVGGLLEAADVLNPDPKLVVMPSHPSLGELREEYAGLLGWIEVRPDERPRGEAGFAGSEQVLGSENFMEQIEESPLYRADSRAYLKARLLDALVGDWDRHPDQWRWAGFREGEVIRFQPVPRDRDWALTRLDGAKMWVSRVPWPHYVGFEEDLPDAFRITWNGRRLDRLLLPELAWEDWDHVARDLQSRMTDEVIESAVRRLPDGYFDVVGDQFTRYLKNRRDQLLEFARESYLLQAGWVDIHATDEAETALVERLPDGSLGVEIFPAESGPTGNSSFFERVFLPEETREVRIYLHGDDDEARVRGGVGGDMTVNIVGGGGDDRFIVEEGTPGKGIRFFDHRGENVFRPMRGTEIDEKSYSDPIDPDDDPHWAGTRDWGARSVSFPYAAFKGDGGLILGGVLLRTGYGFRHYPHRDRIRVLLGYGLRTGRPHLEAEVEFPLHRRAVLGELGLLATGAEVHRFYGFGNQTTAEEGSDAFEAFSLDYQLSLGATYRASPTLSAEVGTLVSSHHPDKNPGTLLARTSPYGFETFNALALTGGLSWARLDNPGWPTRGGALNLQGRFFPALGNVEDLFGALRATASGYLSATNFPLRPTLALRAGGEKVWGPYPYQEAASLGGSENLRGFPQDRFAGDAAFFVNGEVRLRMGPLPVLIPGTWGIMVSTESGRVWVDGEDSDRWHGSFGGGFWVSIIDSFTLSASFARSDEGTRFLYGGGGFHF